MMLIYYSGEGGGRANPEFALAPGANLMLTMNDMKKKATRRFKAIRKARKKGKRNAKAKEKTKAISPRKRN